MIIDDKYIKAAANIISFEVSNGAVLSDNLSKAILPIIWANVVIQARTTNKEEYQKAKLCQNKDSLNTAKKAAKERLEEAKKTYENQIKEILELERSIFNNEQC